MGRKTAVQTRPRARPSARRTQSSSSRRPRHRARAREAMPTCSSSRLVLVAACLCISLLLVRRREPVAVTRILVVETEPATSKTSASSRESVSPPPPPPPIPLVAATINAARQIPSRAAEQSNAQRRHCNFEFPQLRPLLDPSDDAMTLHRAAAGSAPFAGVRRLALPPAPAECAAHIPAGRVVLRSEVHPRRYLVAFPAGGEVFALGVPGRMPLRGMTLELAPADASPEAAKSPWVTLRHEPSNGTMLYMVSPRAAEGAWMVKLMPIRELTSRRNGELFCVNPDHGLYSYAAQGYVNLRGEVLLRGHDRPNTPAGRVPTSRISLLRVTPQAIVADDAYWRCALSGLETQAQSAPALRQQSVASGGANDGELRVLTYATKATPMLCDCLLVAMRAKVPLTLLGFGEDYHGNFQKLRGAREYVADLPPHDLVLFADAYDVLYVAGASELRAGFESLHVPPSKVLFMGERGCWPDWDMGGVGRRFCMHTYPRSPTPYRYVNSGVWMGRAAAAHRLLTVLASYTPGLDDQHVTGHLFVDRNDWFELDRHARLFQSMHGNAADVRMERAGGAPSLHNAMTNSTPRVLHFNGGAKDQFARWRDHLLSGANCLSVDGEFDAPGGPLPYKQVCPHHPLPGGRAAC